MPGARLGGLLAHPHLAWHRGHEGAAPRCAARGHTRGDTRGVTGGTEASQACRQGCEISTRAEGRSAAGMAGAWLVHGWGLDITGDITGRALGQAWRSITGTAAQRQGTERRPRGSLTRKRSPRDWDKRCHAMPEGVPCVPSQHNAMCPTGARRPRMQGVVCWLMHRAPD